MYSLTAPRNGAVLSYLIIDGDDVGGKVEAHLLANDVDSFVASSKEISASIDQLVDSLNEIPGVYVVSAGGDSILARIDNPDIGSICDRLSGLQRPGQFTFSAGMGETLRESFVALRMAKAAGKRRAITYPRDS
ncbi:mCpol domain-containing protein [Streptomyces sp. NBC_00459]|uniref:mCpol domain-containing protein n=1 Tax=Streptomyces sp. NBC_00459 TaxID=2975749 RepID=UPI003FA6DC97